MDWIDDGIVLSVRRHGENALIVSLLTRDHGRHAGLVRGGSGTRTRGLYQPGNLLRAQWRARLAEHLGTWSCELARSYAAAHLQAPLPLLALSAATTLLDMAVPEREPVGHLFGTLESLLDALGKPGWPVRYVRWELDLLAEIGFGLDLSRCAATGARDGLAFVSPKTGRAVSASAAEPWRSRLLPLPAFLLDGAEDGVPPGDLADGLALTGFFLRRHLIGDGARGLPAARQRLAEGLQAARCDP